MKRILNAILAAVSMIMITAVINVHASSPNYYYNNHSNPLWYDGYIQCQPSYNDGGYHAFKGYIRYYYTDANGTILSDTGRLYTNTGTSQSDSRILSRSTRFYDNLSFTTGKTQFFYGFTWVPHGSPFTPDQIRDELY